MNTLGIVVIFVLVFLWLIESEIRFKRRQERISSPEYWAKYTKPTPPQEKKP